MELRLFLRKILLLTLLSIILYPLGVILYMELVPTYFHNNVLYQKFAYGFSNTRFHEVKEVEEIDILFLGSSRAYRHYDPRNFKKFGFSSFNLGSSSQTFLQTEILLERYLEALGPKYVILDVYPGMFSSDGVESSFDLISNDYNDWETLKLGFKVKNIKVVNTWIYALYKEYVYNALAEREKLEQGKNKYILNGYVERKLSTSKVKINKKQKWIFEDNQWESFKEVIRILKNSEAKIIVVHSPRNKGFDYENDYKFIEYLKNQGISYFNYQELTFINDSLHFYDPSHMNQDGVNLYNEFILQQHF